MDGWAHVRKGFTIVELLIVVVVIAILAAITIIAYNGISARAKASAAQTAAESASKKVLTYATTNSEQLPADLATAGVSDSSATSFQYTKNTSVSPQTFCITATTSNTSYYIDNTSHTSPTSGACPGHGLNGIAPIANLITNPSVESSASGWTVSTYGSGGAGSTSLQTTGGANGNNFYRMTWSTANTGGEPYAFTKSASTITNGTVYTCSAYVRTSVAAKVSIRVISFDASDVWITQFASSTNDIAPSTWTRISATGTATPSTVVSARCLFVVTGSTIMPASSTFDMDGVMLTEGSSLYNYADGNSSNWVWDGTQNLSTSRGPVL